MSTMSEARPGELDGLLVDVALLLVERTRRQLEREASQQGGSATDAADVEDLPRTRQLEARLKAIQERLRGQRLPLAAQVAALERQPSRYYEVPGQEDA